MAPEVLLGFTIQLIGMIYAQSVGHCLRSAAVTLQAKTAYTHRPALRKYLD